MKRIIWLFSVVFVIILYNCNNELIDVEEDQEVILIPKKTTYDTGYSSGIQYYNELGQPLVITNQDSTVISRRFTYNSSNQITELMIISFDVGARFQFSYENDNISSVSTFNFGTGCDDPCTITTVSYLSNQIITLSENQTSNNYSTTIFTFENDDYKKLIQAEIIPNDNLLSEGHTKHFYYYDIENRPTSLEILKYNTTSNTFELFFEAEQTFDDKINIFKYAAQLGPVAELYNYRDEFGSFMNYVNRHSPNNMITQIRNPSVNDLYRFQFDYTYNPDNYPISADILYFEAELHTYSIEYY